MFSTVSRLSHVSTPTVRKAKSIKDSGPVFAIIEIEVGGDYRPKNADSCPCDELGDIPVDLVCRFAVMYNADHHAQKNERWACVGLNGGMFFLQGVQAVDRPENSAEFPPGAEVGLTYNEAKELQEAANSERVRLAKVPRRWTVALRPLAPMDNR